MYKQIFLIFFFDSIVFKEFICLIIYIMLNSIFENKEENLSYPLYNQFIA